MLLETITYRFSGHSPSDASSYRVKEEIEAWQAIDPLQAFAKELMEAGVLSEEVLEDRRAETTKAMTQAFRLASDLEVSPRLPSEDIAGLMFSKRKVDNYDPSRQPELTLSASENPRVQALAKKSRAGIIDGKPVSKIKFSNTAMQFLKLHFTVFRMILLWSRMGKKIVTGVGHLPAIAD